MQSNHQPAETKGQVITGLAFSQGKHYLTESKAVPRASQKGQTCAFTALNELRSFRLGHAFDKEARDFEAKIAILNTRDPAAAALAAQDLAELKTQREKEKLVSMTRKFISAWNRSMGSLIQADGQLPFIVKLMFYGFIGKAKEKNWIQETDLANPMLHASPLNFFYQVVAPKLYGLKPADWTPDQGFDQLMKALQAHGAVNFGAPVGWVHYEQKQELKDESTPYRCIRLTSRKNNALTNGHRITIVRAKKERENNGAESQWLDFFDPNDASRPGERRRAYQITYAELIQQYKSCNPSGYAFQANRDFEAALKGRYQALCSRLASITLQPRTPPRRLLAIIGGLASGMAMGALAYASAARAFPRHPGRTSTQGPGPERSAFFDQPEKSKKQEDLLKKKEDPSKYFDQPEKGKKKEAPPKQKEDSSNYFDQPEKGKKKEDSSKQKEDSSKLIRDALGQALKAASQMQEKLASAYAQQHFQSERYPQRQLPSHAQSVQQSAPLPQHVAGAPAPDDDPGSNPGSQVEFYDPNKKKRAYFTGYSRRLGESEAEAKRRNQLDLFLSAIETHFFVLSGDGATITSRDGQTLRVSHTAAAVYNQARAFWYQENLHARDFAKWLKSTIHLLTLNSQTQSGFLSGRRNETSQQLYKNLAAILEWIHPEFQQPRVGLGP